MHFKFLTIFLIGVVYYSLDISSVKAQVSAVPFLLNAPDARSGAMADAGVAISPDVNALSNNPSKLAFLENGYGFSFSYNPWLKSVISDINLGYLSGFYKLDERNTLGISMRYFSLGEIQLADANQQDLGFYHPNEFAVDATFARKFGHTLSIATTLRYINSAIGSGQIIAGNEVSSGTAVAADFSVFFKQETTFLGNAGTIAAGLYISNIGTKLSYTDAVIPLLLPANLKIGTATTFLFNKDSELSIAMDFNKLLVPDSRNPDVDAADFSVPEGVFYALFASNGGVKEKIKEVTVATGLEYRYKKQFALRAGYAYGNPDKGNHSFITTGAGFQYKLIGIDLAYSMANQQHHPLASALRISILLNFNGSYH
jgi:hypothetical protein